MTNRSRFIVNTALLTASDLLMRCVGCAFQMWLAARIGSSGIGLYQLMGAAVGLAVTFAVSGIGFGTTRLVSEELGAGSTRGAVQAVLPCALYALVFGTAAALVLYRFAEPIGFLSIEDGRTVLPLRIMAAELPFLALTCVPSGYFTACGRVGRPTVILLCRQVLSVTVTALLLINVPRGHMESSFAAIALGGTVSEAAGCLAMWLLLAHHVRTHPLQGPRAQGLWRRLPCITLPLAVSAYTRSGLSTLQHMLTPAGLRRSGLTAAGALSAYGMVHGMALTVLYFPTCVLQVVAQLLIPHLTGLQVRGAAGRIRWLCRRMLWLSMGYGAVMAVGLFLWGTQLAEGLYRTPEAAVYIRLLAPLVPLIYMDIVVDGCLKGLGEQLWSMGINIAESAVSVVLTWQLVPLWGIMGYVAVIYFNEVFNFLLSFHRLHRVLKA